MNKIKYHHNEVGNEYGTDGKLTDNWNPSGDYGNEYVKVYFRIDVPSYNYMSGFASQEDREAFYSEANSILESFGIMEDCGYKVERIEDKCAYLYIHPQNISGVIKKNDVKKVAEAISEMKTTFIRWVDLYETVFNMTDEEYGKYLVVKHSEIRKYLFDIAVTTRTNKFYDAFDVARRIANKIRLHRLGIDDGRTYGNGATVEYILKIADEMIEEGYLKTFIDDNGKYIRSLNKTERKKIGLYVA